MAADLIVAGELPTYWMASFHAQQTVEKALKALLTRRQIEFARTHNIGELLHLADAVVPGISSRHDAARDLTRYGTVDRYPGESATVSQSSARRHVDLARTVLAAVSAELRAYLEAGPPAS